MIIGINNFRRMARSLSHLILTITERISNEGALALFIVPSKAKKYHLSPKRKGQKLWMIQTN